jgi:lipopolysaccharide/colanic/teichoic acid biosynthesis glycosyltransferase
VAVVGTGAAAVDLARVARAERWQVLGDVLTPEESDARGASAGGFLVAEGIDRKTLVELAMRHVRAGRWLWVDAAAFPELGTVLPLEPMGNRAGVVLRPVSEMRPLRRLIDVAVSATSIAVLAPLLLLLALLVKCSSTGPVLHRAEVVGRDGRRFTWYKFRTMRLPEGEGDDEVWRKQRFAEFVRGGEVPGKILDQSRVTAIGGLLRRHSLDELPQLLSVLKGDMTLLGPRPCLGYEYELLEPWHRARFHFQPGLTGLWQVRGRGQVRAGEMAFMDVCYGLGRTWRTDVRVVLETLEAVLSGRGAV